MTAPTIETLERLDPRVISYIEAGAGSGSTVSDNIAAWNRWKLRPRVLRDVSDICTELDLFGIRLAAPIFAAPWAGHALVHPDGELATARGLVEAGVGFGVSSGASVPVAEIGAISGPFLQQLYVPEERHLVVEFVRRAVDAGAAAFALTVDHPAVGNGYGFRAGLAGVGFRPSPNFGNVDPRRLGTARTLGPADIGWLADVAGVPVLAKGVSRGDDAEIALDAGAAGIIVSNHGGRQLDGSIPTAQALPEVVEAVAGRGVVLVDGGIRRGEDVVRALALGARAVLVGRPFAWALANGGERGVAALAEELVTGTRIALAMVGASSPDHLTPDLVRWDVA
jgi:4-hydroxymandelate oxidase